MSKIIKNTTLSAIEVKETGDYIAAEGQITIDPSNYRLWADGMVEAISLNSQFNQDLTAGDLVVNDGISDLTAAYGRYYLQYPDWAFNQRFLSEPERPNGFVSKTTQEAIEEGKSGSIGNDLDTLQFGRQGNINNNVYLLTLFNVPGNDSPDHFKYNVLFRGFSFALGNELDSGDSFDLELWKTDSYHLNRQIAYSETFDIANGNFTGHVGQTIGDLTIPIDSGWGVYVRVTNTVGTKPADINVLLWSRQR